MPDQAKVQLAGNVGFLSPGLGYAWLGRRLEADLFFGWVPPPLAGEHIVATTAKVTWAPLLLRTRTGWVVRPLTLAAQLTYTFGSEYFVVLPDHYPPGYFQLPTALRSAFALGAAAGAPWLGLAEVGGYVEVVATDALVGLWIGNPETVGPTDVFSVALGVRAAF